MKASVLDHFTALFPILKDNLLSTNKNTVGHEIHTIATWWMWIGFITFILVMIAIDMFLFGGKKAHRVSTKEALGWVITWVSLALLFNLLLWWYLYVTQGPEIAHQKGLEFLTGYLIEESLSIDNMFVFVMIFKYFGVPSEYQRRVLLFGILGAIVFRFIMIIIGVWLVTKFHWILYIFGVFLLYTGIKMLFANNEQKVSDNSLLMWLQQYVRTTKEFHGEKFFIRKNKFLYATPLFVTLVFIEICDIIFAVDSIPAIFAIVDDPFIIFTSNIFAILGLRALYFLVANMSEKFYFLRYGLSLILIFIGCKMLAAYWFKIPIGISLSVIAVVLLSSILLSVIYNPNNKGKK